MATLKYIQFLERNKISMTLQDRKKVYSICTSVFPDIPEEAHKIPWSLRNMEPSFMNSIRIFECDEVHDKTSNVAITFTFDGPNILKPDFVCSGEQDPYTPCRDLNIRTEHYDVYNFQLNQYMNFKIPQGSIIKEIGACNEGNEGEVDNIYTFTASLRSPSYIDDICKAVYEYIHQIGFSKINHIVVDTLSDNGYDMMTSLLMASHYDLNAKEKEEDEEDEDGELWCWHSISSIIKHWDAQHNESVRDEIYNYEMNVLCSSYETIHDNVYRFGIDPHYKIVHGSSL